MVADRIHSPVPATPPSPLGLPAAPFADACARAGLAPRDRALDDYRAFHRTGAIADWMNDAPLAGPIVREQREEVAEGTTVKFLQRIARGAAPDSLPRHAALNVESVIIPMIGRGRARTHTLCVSSQVGCAMGCEFCETARMGLLRSLTPGEIVGQWWAARHILGAPIRNLVFMGMGEPLDNLDAVLDAVAILTDHDGPALAMSRITISTVGRIDGLRRLAAAMDRPGWRRLGLAVSINAPNDTIRSAIMPINRAMPMAELRDAVLAVPGLGRGRKVCFEYVLIPGVNDAPGHADELADYLRPFTAAGSPDGLTRGMVNVIPYNPRRESPWPAPSERSVERFVECLVARGLFVRRRRTKGRTMMGACGQLGTDEIRRRRFVALGTGGVNAGC